MRTRPLLLVLVLALASVATVAAAPDEDGASEPVLPGTVVRRAEEWTPKPPGTQETVRFRYGPYTLGAGTDLHRLEPDLRGLDGFITGARPVVRYADGSEAGHEVHIHHAHVFRGVPGEGEGSWIFGSGGETTQGTFSAAADADPRGHRYGIPLSRGEPLAMLSMLMNTTERDLVIWMEFEFQFVHGTRAQIREATGQDYHPLTPVIVGDTFDVPRTGGVYAWPRDMQPGDGSDAPGGQTDRESFMSEKRADIDKIEPGQGIVWESPLSGEIVVTAAHMHKGGIRGVMSNLGSAAAPCPDDEGDGYPGALQVESRSFTPGGVFPGHPTMGISQPGWRASIREGDRLALNGEFDATDYAYPDQMTFFGFYVDEEADVPPERACGVRLVDEPDAGLGEVVQSLPDQDAERGATLEAHGGHGGHGCVADACDDHDAPPVPRGRDTTTVAIQDFTFLPGGMGAGTLTGMTGPSALAAPVVTQGETLRFLNLDFVGRATVRHAVTSCRAPCNGPDNGTYPNHDGRFYSGPMGYTPLSENPSVNVQAAPEWELDTSELEPGYHTYYCHLHPWMRGAFYVEAPTEGGDEAT